MSSTTKAPPALKALVSEMFRGKDRDPELFETARGVERMLTMPGFAAVGAVIGAETAKIDRELDGRPLENASEYAHKHGRRGALTAFPDAAAAIVEVAAERLSKSTAEAEHKAAGESAAER